MVYKPVTAISTVNSLLPLSMTEYIAEQTLVACSHILILAIIKHFHYRN